MDYTNIKYQHICKIESDEVEGLTNGICYIYPKIDGTNCPIWFDSEQDKIMVGSRNRVLSEEQDNAGAYQTIHNDESLLRFFHDYPNYILYTEFLVPHTIKRYQNTAWKHFYVFDVVADNVNHDVPQYLSYEEYAPLMEKYNISYIPLIDKIQNPSIEQLTQLTECNTYLIKENDGIGEGIVIKRYNYINKYGRRTWGKIVVEDFKKKRVQKQPAPQNFEQQVVEHFLTIEFIEKEYEKIVVQNGKWEDKCIPRLLGTIWHEFINDYMFDIILRYKNPTINFKLLQIEVINMVKQIKSELF